MTTTPQQPRNRNFRQDPLDEWNLPTLDGWNTFNGIVDDGSDGLTSALNTGPQAALPNESNAPHQLRNGSFSQNWTVTSQIATNDDWSGVPSIVGFRTADVTSATGVDARTIITDAGFVAQVFANVASTFTSGGVSEVETGAGIGGNPTIAFQGANTNDYSAIVIYLDTTEVQNARLTANVRDVDGGGDDAVQQVVVQYRIGSSGNWTNLSYFADVTTAGSATQVTAIDVVLPDAADNQPDVQIRILTTNSPGNDELVGIDDIVISSEPLVAVVPALSIDDVSRNEADGTITFTVSLSAPAPAGGVTFDIATADGTASAGSDYAARTLTGQTIAAGATSYSFIVTLGNDVAFEGTETFTVNLSNVTGATVSDALGTGTIIDDELQPALSVTDVTQVEGNAGTTSFAFTVTLSAVSSQTVTVNYASADGTAVAGSDYAAASGTLVFAPGETSKTINVLVNGDTAIEATESFFLNLSGATNATLADAQGVGTITTDDFPAAGTLAIGPATQSQNEGQAGATAFTFTVTRTGGSAGAASVAVTLVNGTTDAADFAGGLSAGTVTFADGDDAPKTVTVTVGGDTLVEGDESFSVQLSNATGASLSATTTAAATITNDDTSYAIAAGQASEAIGTIPLVVTRTGVLDATSLTWTVSLAGGDTATAADFAAGLPSGTVTFLAGAATATINVPVLNDVLVEPNETFTVTLSGATGGQTIAVPSATATILNDDQPAVSISDATVVEGAAGTVQLIYTISTDQPAGAEGITFTVTTSDGTATAGSDYTSRTFTGTIAAGQSSAAFTVDVTGDTMAEQNETLFATLSGVTGATIGRAQATGTIQNDDGAPTSARLFETSFAGFTGTGFAPTPAAGQLDSDIWRVLGLSDNLAPVYGGTYTTGDFARGLIAANPTTGGVYSSAANNALILQPTGADFADGAGAIEARIQNTTGLTAVSFQVAFDWVFRNNEPRSSGLQLSYSTDGVGFTDVPASAFSTPGTADSTVFTNSPVSVTLSGLAVADGGFLFLRWNNTGSTGAGNRDEVGIDNIVVDAGLSDASVLTFSDVVVTEGDAGTSIATLTLTRTRTEDAASIDFATADGVALAGQDYLAQNGTVSFAVGQASQTIQFVIIGDTRNEPNESFVVNLFNANGFLLPDAQARVTIVNNDTGPVSIGDIQGLGHVSTFVGLTVATTGVVTALRSNGFFLQSVTGDGDTRTSDAIFVFTTGAPTVAVGNEITLSGTVSEFRANAANLSLTQLSAPTAIVVVNPSVALPAATLISTGTGGYAPPTEVIDDDGLTVYQPATDGIDYYESLEGMRVTVEAPLVVAPTDGIGQTYVVASLGAGATNLNDRGGLTISADDYQPEKIKLFQGSGGPVHSQGDVLADVTGILTYFGNAGGTSAGYQVDPSAQTTAVVDRPLASRETSTLRGDGDSLSYASFNVENLGPVAFLNPGADFESQADVDLQYAQHAFEIVNALNSPDIIGLQEIQDANGANAGGTTSGEASAQKLIDAVVAAGGPQYRYVEVAPENNTTGGQPNGNIRNGYLYNPERVSYVDGSIRLLTDAAYNGTRRPVIAEFVFNGETFTAIDVHATSRIGSTPLFGAVQPPAEAGDAARTAQAQGVRNFIDQLLAANPAAKVIVNGDFNGFSWEAALQRITQGGFIQNLYDLLPEEERYSFLFDGNYQQLDHILVSTALTADIQFDVVHYNAGYPSAASATDHDQPLALIGIVRAGGAATAIADGFTTTEAALYRGTVLANDIGGTGTLSVATVNGAAVDGSAVRLASGALLALRADGTFVYDPDGAFSTLAAGAVTTDSFAYALTGGGSATVSVTITGLDPAAPTAGNDVVAGTAGPDLFNLGAGGIDTVSGGAADDAFLFGATLTAADLVNGGSGRDVLGIQGNYGGLTLGAGNLTNVETLSFLSGADARFGDAAGNRYSYVVASVDANVAAGQQLIVNGAALLATENLTFDGSAETDGTLLIYGGAGTDVLTGGAGADIFFLADGRLTAGDRFIGGAGADIVTLRGDYSTTPVVLAANSFDGIETLSLVSSADTRFFAESGTLYSYAITSNDGNVAAGATLTVNGARLQVGETLSFDGSAELDGMFRLFGGADSDVLRGGAGADLLFGGGSGDTLTGGGGDDVFRYDNLTDSNATERDTILDFTLGDLIDLSRLDADLGADGDQAFSFLGTGAFTGTAGQLRVVNTGGTTFAVSGDVDGDGVADFQITVVVADGDPIVAADFVL